MNAAVERSAALQRHLALVASTRNAAYDRVAAATAARDQTDLEAAMAELGQCARDETAALREAISDVGGLAWPSPPAPLRERIAAAHEAANRAFFAYVDAERGQHPNATARLGDYHALAAQEAALRCEAERDEGAREEW
jgi:hypothetical protein